MIDQFRTSTLSLFLPQCKSSRYLARLFVFILFITATASANQNQAIRSVLETQLKHWNEGDIPAFMEGYLHSKKLRFASGDHVNYGWETTLQRYQQHYPDKKQMGQLSFDLIDIKNLGDNYALVFGRWSLQREKDHPHGLFTLTFEKTVLGWKIIHDHTSSGEQ